MRRQRSYNKFRNKPQVVDGIKFPSILQATQYKRLKLLQDAHQILNLSLEVPFEICVNGELICKYTADFVYEEPSNPKVIIHEAKGEQTPAFRLKWKLMKALYPNFEYRLVFR